MRPLMQSGDLAIPMSRAIYIAQFSLACAPRKKNDLRGKVMREETV